jgi:hypothetical protein
MTAINRQRIIKPSLWLLCAVALVLPACDSDGHFSILGYSTVPNYDPNIRTVYVPIFNNNTFVRGLEFDLTDAVIKAIEQQTPFKVVHQAECADTELDGTIMAYNKTILNVNQQNEVREAQMGLTVQVVWKDRRTGEILSGPGGRLSSGPPMGAPAITAPAQPNHPVAAVNGQPGTNAATQVAPGDGSIALPLAGAGGIPGALPVAPPAPSPALATSFFTYVPEVGQSNASARQKNVQRVAMEIVGMMEQGW